MPDPETCNVNPLRNTHNTSRTSKRPTGRPNPGRSAGVGVGVGVGRGSAGNGNTHDQRRLLTAHDGRQTEHTTCRTTMPDPETCNVNPLRNTHNTRHPHKRPTGRPNPGRSAGHGSAGNGSTHHRRRLLTAHDGRQADHTTCRTTMPDPGTCNVNPLRNTRNTSRPRKQPASRPNPGRGAGRSSAGNGSVMNSASW
ncbi:hypothetical protein [Kitasatospora kifunensis]|uniref:Uncharacterized protein n=1 Tax=Kitasatospora kifunensis TaxID=58351 RepID=A0A7W7R9Z8_KITKI|nr:hypothetical protein [Kitasatospora kifunensis]MBB4928131.1 hypothetical protein [Kitasatospora kifunensis]